MGESGKQYKIIGICLKEVQGSWRAEGPRRTQISSVEVEQKRHEKVSKTSHNLTDSNISNSPLGFTAVEGAVPDTARQI